MVERENDSERRSLGGWLFLIVTVLALGYWLWRVVLPAILAASPV
jgi:hypothetical protein